MNPLSCFEKIWRRHVIASSPDGLDLLYVDRHYLTDLSATIGFEDLEARGNGIREPGRTFVMPDHVIETGDDGSAGELVRRRFIEPLARNAAERGLVHFGRGSGRQGIVHVVALEQGLSLPGATIVCGDSHTSSHGAVGAIALGIGQTEIRHVLATQTLWLRLPLLARVIIDGRLPPGVYAKDVALSLIGHLGADYGREHAIEFDGPATQAMTGEERATLCNLAVELGARFGLVAPDATTAAYLANRPWSPSGELLERALAEWSALRTDAGAAFSKEVRFDVGAVEPQVTWGTSPEHVVSVGGVVPDRADAAAAYEYMGLRPGDRLADVTVDHVFIGSCTNSRIEDLRVAAQVAARGRVAPHVRAIVVPGSEEVAAQAEREGLTRTLLGSGFEVRLPGCSMCVAVNGDVVPAGSRCVSTSNRNFVGRQGPGARTHLASPATAAASALAGRIADPRQLIAELA